VESVAWAVKLKPTVPTAALTALLGKLPEGAHTELGRLDVLVNNAGVAHGGLFQMTSVNTIREIFEINFFSVLEFSQAVIRLMQKKRNGSIALTTSGATDAVALLSR